MKKAETHDTCAERRVGFPRSCPGGSPTVSFRRASEWKIMPTPPPPLPSHHTHRADMPVFLQLQHHQKHSAVVQCGPNSPNTPQKDTKIWTHSKVFAPHPIVMVGSVHRAP
ncbi:hypothetical protein DQ04_12191000 [Trypanosoma grayi]|uniref:hypothetical protein n=1 Tax=Trypanosoma grayi TaxID=71804 RepID=UPI0004F41CA9|nr:hypothetical protein DQ04_12191000 [Trypanosoma grayi]KEG06796.1 hypothetical protein DQ04_12191000 [Trypanosoma grayi]